MKPGSSAARDIGTFRKAKSDLLVAQWVGIQDNRVFDLKGRW